MILTSTLGLLGTVVDTYEQDRHESDNKDGPHYPTHQSNDDSTGKESYTAQKRKRFDFFFLGVVKTIIWVFPIISILGIKVFKLKQHWNLNVIKHKEDTHTH